MRAPLATSSQNSTIQAALSGGFHEWDYAEVTQKRTTKYQKTYNKIERVGNIAYRVSFHGVSCS